MVKIAFVACEKVIDTEHLISPFKEAINQMRAQEAGPTCYENSSSRKFFIPHPNYPYSMASHQYVSLAHRFKPAFSDESCIHFDDRRTLMHRAFANPVPLP